MKKLYNSFSKDKRPEWLTLEDILQYEKTMITERKNNMDNKVKTSKGIFKIGNSGGNNGYEINKISECCLGYFVLLENGQREYFKKIDDVLTIRKAYKIYY